MRDKERIWGRIYGRIWLAATALAAATLVGLGARALADGAIAVGSTGDVVRDGIAFGMTVNKPRDKAAEIAIGHCRTFHARAAAERCKVVATFAGECFAIAYDPKPATPGAGWGVGPDQLAANDRAIAMCEKTAGPDRQGYCQVERGGCDVTGRRTAQNGASKAARQVLPAAPGPETGKPQAERTDRLDTPDAGPPSPPASAAQAETAAETPDPSETTGPRGGAPLLPLGALIGVGAAYALGQYGRGRLREGIGSGQIRTGGALAIGAAVLVAVLDMLGVQTAAGLVLATAIAIAAAILA